jgi:hypothetical protein
MLPPDQRGAEGGRRQQGQKRYEKAGSIKSEQEFSSTTMKMQKWCQEIASPSGTVFLDVILRSKATKNLVVSGSAEILHEARPEPDEGLRMTLSIRARVSVGRW